MLGRESRLALPHVAGKLDILLDPHLRGFGQYEELPDRSLVTDLDIYLHRNSPWIELRSTLYISTDGRFSKASDEFFQSPRVHGQDFRHPAEHLLRPSVRPALEVANETPTLKIRRQDQMSVSYHALKGNGFLLQHH